MNIVHYTLGVFPNRAGGLIRYATDLAKEQALEHNVCILMPGSWNPFWGKCCISKGDTQKGLVCYKLKNALPQPLLYGIKRPKDFMEVSLSYDSFERFFCDFKPDILHIHTLMGLPEKVLCYFKEKGVKIVYTSHDYFGICPKVNLITPKGELCAGPSLEKCFECNIHSKGTVYLRMRSSNLAYKIRDLVRWIKITFHF